MSCSNSGAEGNVGEVNKGLERKTERELEGKTEEKTEEKTEKQKLHLVIRDFVSVNHYLAYRVIYKHGCPAAMSYKTQEALTFHRKFVEYVKQEVKKQHWRVDMDPMQHYYVDAVFYFPRIDMDCNNYWKVAFDAITESGVVWSDDNMACERVIKVMYDSKDPRIEYTIYKTDFVGVFDDEEEKDGFVERCEKCVRYNRNCSILKKALEGRVQDEIKDGICEKFKEGKRDKEDREKKKKG